MKTKDTTMKRFTASSNHTTRGASRRGRARVFADKALSIVMSAILVVGLSPLTKVSTATAGEGEASASASTTQLHSSDKDHQYWYNGEVNFTTIDKSNTFTSKNDNGEYIWGEYFDRDAGGNFSNALGIAGSFHLVAFDTLNTKCDVYGNVLANNVSENNDFGTKWKFVERYDGRSTLSYIRNYQGTFTRFGKNDPENGFINENQVIVFGSNTDTFSLFSMEENNHNIINYRNAKTDGTKVMFPSNIAQDIDSGTSPFINLNDVKEEAEDLSNTLASRSSLGGATYDFSDRNNKSITYTKGSGCAYVDLPLSVVRCDDEVTKNTGNDKGNPIYINNVPLDGTGTLVINVDCQGLSAESITLPNEIILKKADGSKANTGEVDTDKDDANKNIDTGWVLWNFYNVGENTTITGATMVSSILAPNANLILDGNACGTFIANNITARQGETHMRPFHGKFTDSDTTSVSVEKKWLDSKGNAESGVSHDPITAELWYADESGKAMKAVEVQLSAENSWKHTWTDLPTKVNGETVHYTVKESGLSSNDGQSYGSSITGSGNSFTITNRHNPEVTVSATKVWEDNNNIDGVRPSYVTASIWRQVEGGDWVKMDDDYKLTLNETNGWKATSKPLPATDATGNAYTYKVEEELEGNLGGKYACSNIESESSSDDHGNKTYAFKLTNTHESSQINVKVKKDWVDGDNQDGARPKSVTVDLKRSANGGAEEIVQTLELKAPDWTAQVEGLRKSANNETYTYSVTEHEVAGYTGTVKTTTDDNGNYTFELANTHTPETTSVGVHKVWEDADNAGGIRPDSVTVQLCTVDENGVEHPVEGKTVELSSANGWAYTWDGLAKKSKGEDITYKVVEAGDVNGYTAEVTGGLATDGSRFNYTLTNKYNLDKTSVKVEKQWKAADGTLEGGNHNEVTVQLYKKVGSDQEVAVSGYTMTLNADNSWRGSWTELPAKVKGETVEYSVKEKDTLEGYTPSVTKNNTADGGFSYTLTNTKQNGPVTTQVSVVKKWEDANNQDGLRSDSVKVQLLANGKAVEGSTKTLSADNNWAANWADLAKYADGKAVTYTVAEVEGPTGYIAEITGSEAADGSSFSYTLTNKHEADKTSVSVHKAWVDANNQDGLRPATVKVQLYADGKASGDPVELSSALNGWDYSWKNLDKKADGKEIIYTVAELDVPEAYTAVTTGSNNAFVITNTHTTATTEVSVEKQWAASDGTPDASDHAAITVQLYKQVAGGEVEPMDGYTIELSQANNWKGGWSNLPVKQNGEAITYSVAEVDVPAGYTSKVTDGESANSFVITNTADAKTQVSVTKVWDDADNADGLRSDSVTAQLCTVDSQGAAYPVAGKTVELSAGNNWTYTWDDLNLNDVNGKAITYTVQEANVPAGYAFELSGGKQSDGTFAFTMTNTHERSTTQVSVAKKWNDSDNADGLRPDSVTAQLYTVDAQGALTAVEGKTAVLSEENNWTASWTGLAAKEAGKAIKYTVREADVPDGYTVDIQGVAADDGTYAFTMTNTHEQEEAELSLAGYSVRSLSASAPEADKVCYVDPKVTKVLTGRTLADGEFAFQLIDDATGNVVSSATNDAKGMVDFDKANNVSGDDMNPCCLQFTAAGTYTYTVRENPSAAKDPTIDYSKEVVTFVTTIVEETAADGTKSLKEQESKYVCYDSAADRAAGVAGKVIAVTGAATEHPTITNSVKAIQLGLTKFNADSTTTLEGAVYGLYRAGSVSSDGSSDAVLVAKATSDADGHMTFATTDASEVISEDTEYWFQEISAPEGYKLSLDPTQKFQVKRVGEGDAVKYQLAYADGTASKVYSIGTVIEFGDGAGVTDEALTIKVNKVDSARQGLSGAKLGVRLADSTDALEEWTSNGAGHVLGGLVAGKQYVLYESEAPNGYAKAADVTFTVDESGAIKLVENAFAKVNDKDVLNAYATDSEASLVNYKSSETVDKKVVQTEQAKTTTTTSKTSTVKTGDSLPVGPIAAVAAVAAACLLIAGAAALASRRRRNK